MANENNYFEFLDIPDGSGGTERWYAKDAEARAAIAQLDPASVIEVADVTQLTSAQVEGLVVGGAVNKSDATGKHSYRVTYKSATGCCLTYYDAENIETVAYEKSEDTWAYLDTTITAIADKADKSQLSGKADKVSGSNLNNTLAGLNSNGNLKASGLTIADVEQNIEDMTDVKDAIGYTAEFVDLGLPSGTLWAKMNIGATAETGYGNYYMYGKGDRQYNSEDEAYEGIEDPLASDKDTATVVLGAPWHMPTKAQFEELIANTTYTWEEDFNDSGINGGKFTAQNGNYVFFPAAGYWDNGSQTHVDSYGLYWSSSSFNSNNAYGLLFGSSYEDVNGNYRYYGSSVRPVMDGTIEQRKVDKTAGVTGVSYDSTNAKFTKTINGTTTDVVALDTTPTSNSKAPVTSGGVYAAIQAALINPISDSSITAASSFAARDCVNVDGTMYLCDQATNEYPKKTPVVQGSDIVVFDGKMVVDNPTASNKWHAI